MERLQKIGVIMNGVTGRMGTNQHLVRSLLQIRKEGGLRISQDERVMPEPILVGRSAEKLKRLAREHGITGTTTSLDEALSDPFNRIYFDSQSTSVRAESVLRALRAGKAVYSEKPLASSLGEALLLVRDAEQRGLPNGVVQDKLWLPGILKLKRLIDGGFFGEIYSVRGEFGYWVFDGTTQASQRPSWNYRKEDGGGIIKDMFCHWRYMIDALFGSVKAISCLGTTHVTRRLDEAGKTYECTADDAAYASMMCARGVICQFNSSWAVRVRRDDLLTLQVDGSRGSAVAGLRRCFIQASGATPRSVWNPDVEAPVEYTDGWEEFAPGERFENAFRAEWELFLKHVIAGEPFRWTFREGAKGVQLAELAEESWRARRWVDVPEL